MKLLGLEVPVTPVATLLEISTTSIAVHWKPPEQRSSAIKHIVNVNGASGVCHVYCWPFRIFSNTASAGEVSNHGNAVSIINLQPGHFYTIRIIAINASNFQASSEAIRVRTNDLSITSREDSQNVSDAKRTATPSIVSYKAFIEAQTASTAAPVMTREHSGSVSQSKRGSTVRHHSSANHGDPTAPPSESGAGHGETANALTDLTTKLESIRRDIDDLEKQDEEEERDFQNNQVALTERREALRQQLKGRDDESNDLKKNVTSLERQNTTVQNKRVKHERLLNQKLNERSKLQDEVKRWKREAAELHQEAADMATQKAEFLTSAQDQFQSIAQEQEEDMQAMKILEEKIRETGTRVKDLEEEKRGLEEHPVEAGLSERQRKTAQEETDWIERLQLLQTRYQNAWSACSQAQQLYHQTQQRLDYLNARHSMQANAVPSQYPTESQSGSNDASSSQTNGGSRNSFVGAEPGRPQSLSSRGLPSAGAVFQTPSPFFSTANLLPPSTNIHQGISEAEVEILTGGALMSPTAGALLPAGLLGDDVEDVVETDIPTLEAPYLPGLGTAPEPDNFELLDDVKQTLISPLSIESQSPSRLSSPQGSISNFHSARLSEGRIDSDRVSVRSTSSSTRVGQRRFADVFARSRATSNEGLPLGSLKRYQSRSMPRQDEDVSSGARSSSGLRAGSSGGLFGSVSQAFGRMGGPSGKVVEETEIPAPGPSAGRGGSLGLFTSRVSPWARNSSPRPASTYSTYSMENALPPPSTDSQPFGWSANDNPSQHPSTRTPSISSPWQALSSRRPSIQHESTTSLVPNISELDIDSQELPEAEKSPPQAPIGTKPLKTKHTSPHKQLNPAARDFRSMMSRDKKGDKSRKADKTAGADEEYNITVDTPSPSESRKSKENRFSSAAESFEEPFDDQIMDSPVKSNEKESFVRKLTRKGSSTRFVGFPSGLFSRKVGQSTEELDEDGSGSNLGRSLESVASGQHSPGDKRRLLSSFKRRGKKGTETPSISEASIASETGDEIDERASVDVEE